jgi:cell division protein FtsQ
VIRARLGAWWGGLARPRKAAVVAAPALLLALGAPWWGRWVLARLTFFHVRRVEIEGARYVAPRDIVTRLRVDTSSSVWDDLRPLERRVAQHPQIASVEIERRLPGTLVVRVTENLPVALFPTRAGFRALDAGGRALPVEPSETRLDLPILAQRDMSLLRLLAAVRQREPSLFARISEVRRQGRGELLVQLTTVPVRAMADVTAERLADVLPVERDLARRGARVAELDLRFRDQVIARLQ